MDRYYLVGVDSVFVDDYATGELGDGYHLVGGFHTTLLNSVDAAVDHVIGSAVERSGVDMDHERLAGEFLGGDAGEIGQPVVGMDDVEFALMLKSDGTAHLGIAAHLLEEVGAILPGELELLAETYGSFGLALAFHPFDSLEVFVGVYVRDDVGVDVDKLDFVEEFVDSLAYILNRHVAGVEDGSAALVFVAAGRRHHEESLHAVVGEAFYDALACGTESACDMGRKLPAKHQYSHGYASL